MTIVLTIVLFIVLTIVLFIVVTVVLFYIVLGMGWGLQIGAELTEVLLILSSDSAVDAFKSRAQVWKKGRTNKNKLGWCIGFFVFGKSRPIRIGLLQENLYRIPI